MRSLRLPSNAFAVPPKTPNGTTSPRSYYAGLDAFAQRVGDAQPKIPLRPLLSHLEAFWMPVDEDLIVVSAEAEDGLFLEWNDHWIELRTWGWLHDQLHD